MSYSLYDYHIEIFRDERDGDFGAFLKEIPYVSAFGSDPASAVRELETAFNLWLKTSMENGDKIPTPSPSHDNADDYSGRLSVRIPKSLHKQLSDWAKTEEISLNQEILYLLSFASGIKRAGRTG